MSMMFISQQLRLENQLPWSNHHLKTHAPPVSTRNYESQKCVLASARTISDYKQMLASQVEQDAAVALQSKDENVKSTLHDTTTRNTIDGEWPAIILYFSNGDEYFLRPLFFAYEDRKQIAELLVETYSRLSVVASVDKQENITPAVLLGKNRCNND